MNTTTSPNSMMSLLMSLGGTLGERMDLSRLELSADGASGATDFSSLLEKLTASEDGSASLGALFQLEDGSLNGQMLPPGFALKGNGLPSEFAAATEDMSEEDLNQLLAHIADPPQVSVSLAPVAVQGTPAQMSAQITDDKVMLTEDAGTESGPDYELYQGKEALMNAGQGEGRGVVNALTAELRRMAQAKEAGSDYQGELNKPGQVQQQLQQYVQDRRADALDAQSLPDQSIDDAELNGLILSDGASEDPDFLQMQRDRMNMGSTSGMFQQNDNGLTAAQQVLAGADAAAVKQETREQADAIAELTDADEMLAEDNFQERLQNQLNDKMRLGEDRREWGPALGARVLTMVADDIQQARIHLDPPELGSLEIKLQVHQDQTSVQIHASNHQVRDVLEASAQRLRDALSERGLELAGFDVQTGGGREQQSGSGSQSGGQGGSDGLLAVDSAVDEAPAQSQKTSEMSLLDTFA